MAGGLYNRVASRGFPSWVADGVTGAGALASQGSTVDPAHGQAVDGTGRGTTLTGFQPEAVTEPDGTPLLEGTWGLPGGTMPDHTPRTHAAPSPGWAGSYSDPDLLQVRENSADIHAADFGALTRHVHVNTGPEPEWDIWTSNSPGETPLQPVDGQLRAMGHGDIVQGYGRMNGYGFDAGHRTRITATDPQPMAYLDPAERPFIVPQASGSFAPTDAVQGPQPTGTYLDAGNINATPQSTYVPADADPPASANASVPVTAVASTGWR